MLFVARQKDKIKSIMIPMAIKETHKKADWWDIIIKTIEKVGTPLSANEIWENALKYKLLDDFSTKGKTPTATIAAYCYTNINNEGDKSKVIQTSKRPAQFFLRSLVTNEKDIKKIQKEKDSEVGKNESKKVEKRKDIEKSLHPLLVAFAYSDSHFMANLKTIRHEESSKSEKGKNEWLHPDIVGVYFPFDYEKETLELQKHVSISSLKLFSFELKIHLDFSNLRLNYFQAVSNSSWANEGYLVTLNIEDDPALIDEIRRLNNAFGIGLIKLDSENVFESEILFPAKINSEIDWDTVNRLASENPGFKDFLKFIDEDCKIGKIKSQYDKVLPHEELEKHIKEKGIKN